MIERKKGFYEQIRQYIEKAGTEVEQLKSRGDIIYLTLSGPELVCKPDAKKYTKTVKWKADEVQEWAGKYKSVVFIDDEMNNRLEVMKLALSNVDCFESLTLALEAIYTDEAIAQEDAMIDEEISPEADIIMHMDPAVRNAYEEELVNPSPKRPRDDGGPAMIL